jgi:hypothetical protein
MYLKEIEREDVVWVCVVQDRYGVVSCSVTANRVQVTLPLCTPLRHIPIWWSGSINQFVLSLATSENKCYLRIPAS